MASSQDTEITLGTGKLLFLFFGLVGVCALFFALGYSLGRKSETGLTTTAARAASATSSAGKASSGAVATPPMTFYKSVEQKDANPVLTPGADATTTPKPETGTAPATATPTQSGEASPPDPTITLPTQGYFVQVAAVSKQEDAASLVEALKKKQYPAFVAAQSPTDKLFRVQLGAFSDIKDAEAMRTRLVADGYSPILKK